MEKARRGEPLAGLQKRELLRVRGEAQLPKEHLPI